MLAGRKIAVYIAFSLAIVGAACSSAAPELSQPTAVPAAPAPVAPAAPAVAPEPPPAPTSAPAIPIATQPKVNTPAPQNTPSNTSVPTEVPPQSVATTSSAQPTTAPVATFAVNTPVPIAPTATNVPATPVPPTEVPVLQPALLTSDVFEFKLESLTIKSGDTISWTNLDRAPHTVTAGNSPSSSGGFDSGTFSKDESFSFRFDEPGDYLYFCKIHPFMKGTIIVTN